MPYIAPIIAHVDAVGRLFCTDCDPELITYPVYGNQHFGADDKCERCEKMLQHVPTSAYVYVNDSVR